MLGMEVGRIILYGIFNDMKIKQKLLEQKFKKINVMVLNLGLL